MPLASWCWTAATNFISKSLTELATPVANGFVSDEDASIQHHLLYVAIAEGERVVQPDAVADDLGAETDGGGTSQIL